MDSKNLLRTVRKAALVEGISFLLLVGIAMPLKYMFKMPAAVKVIGLAHGILFIALSLLLLLAVVKARLPIGRAALVFLSSLLPFGPMILDRRMRSWEKSEIS